MESLLRPLLVHACNCAWDTNREPRDLHRPTHRKWILPGDGRCTTTKNLFRTNNKTTETHLDVSAAHPESRGATKYFVLNDLPDSSFHDLFFKPYFVWVSEGAEKSWDGLDLKSVQFVSWKNSRHRKCFCPFYFTNFSITQKFLWDERNKWTRVSLDI